MFVGNIYIHIFHKILAQFIFQLQYHWIEKLIIPVKKPSWKMLSPSKECTWKIDMYWVFYGMYWIRKKYVPPPNGALVELKQWSDPYYNCR